MLYYAFIIFDSPMPMPFSPRHAAFHYYCRRCHHFRHFAAFAADADTLIIFAIFLRYIYFVIIADAAACFLCFHFAISLFRYYAIISFRCRRRAAAAAIITATPLLITADAAC
jgi:hypothetical protein